LLRIELSQGRKYRFRPPSVRVESGVGRTVADGTYEDDARAARMDERVVWEARKEGAHGVG